MIRKSRYTSRSLTINHLCHKHRTSKSETTLPFQKFATSRDKENYFSLSSFYRHSYPKADHPWSKRFVNARRKYTIRSSSSSVSDDNLLNKIIIGNEDNEMPPIFLSDESSQSDDIELESNDTIESFLDSFAATIKQDVDDAIFKIDAGAFPVEQPITKSQSLDPFGDNIQPKIATRAPTSAKNMLRKRWERILGNEEERHGFRNRARSNREDFKNPRLSIEDLWDASFRRNGYCIAPKLFGKEPVLNKIKIMEDDRDESFQDIHLQLSPIFRYPVYEELCLTDLETLVSKERKENNDHPTYQGKIEIIPFVFNNSINDESANDVRPDSHQKGILRSISLLIAMRPKDWRQFDSEISINTETETEMEKKETSIESSGLDKEMHIENELINEERNLNKIQNNMTEVRNFLHHVMEHKHGLSTSMANLLLAHLVVSINMKNEEIGDVCLQIFEEMNLLAESGLHKCGPDSTTYRILILAFSRKLQGIGEAVKVTQKMMENPAIDITPELLNEALRACHAKTELSVAKSLINSALSDPRASINVRSCIIYTEILKTQKLDEEAIDFFSRIQKAGILTQTSEDAYLESLCQWPKRSRRGDVLDLSSFWTEIMCILEKRTLSVEKPDIRVWITFLEGLHNSAKNDDSLWNMVGGATRTILDSYPRSFVGTKLMAIGLDASSSIEDTELAAMILKRVANEPSFRHTQPNRLSGVPVRALKNALEVCLQASDAESSRSIRESLEQMGDSYPIGAKSELHSLVLLCHAKVNDAENAKRDLDMMIDGGLKPSEELYSAVLHTMAVTDRFREMEDLFKSMQMTSEKGTKPGVLSYDAILLARIRAGSWDGAITLYEQMIVQGVIPSAHTIQGLLLATGQKGGRLSVISALESLLQCDAQFDETAFRLASKTFFKGEVGNLEELRKNIRDIGEQNLNLKAPSLNLARSIRSAQIESSRPKTQKIEYEIKLKQKEAWQKATSHLLEFVKIWSENEDSASKI